MKAFILASASPRRLELLTRIGLTPNAIIPADIDETPGKNELPHLYVTRMAEEKARVVAAKNPDAIILSADTIVVCGRRILPKAENAAQAADCLTLLSGRRHRVYTAVSLHIRNDIKTRMVQTVVQFSRLTPEQHKAYLDSGEWEGKAGGYAIQGIAEQFIIKINGSYSNVVGLPLREATQLLQQAGIKAW